MVLKSSTGRLPASRNDVPGSLHRRTFSCIVHTGCARVTALQGRRAVRRPPGAVCELVAVGRRLPGGHGLGAGR